MKEGDAAGTSRSMLLVIFHVISFIVGRRSRSKLTGQRVTRHWSASRITQTPSGCIWWNMAETLVQILQWCTSSPKWVQPSSVFFKRAVLSSHFYCLAGHRDSSLSLVQTSLSQPPPLALLFGHWIGDVLKWAGKHFLHVLGLLLDGRITQLRCIQEASSQEAWTITEGTAALLWITQILIQPLLSLYYRGQPLVHL